MDADKLKGQLDMIVLAALVAGSARGFGVREIKRVLRAWPFAASVRRSQPQRPGRNQALGFLRGRLENREGDGSTSDHRANTENQQGCSRHFDDE
jgi:hypothetical protein